MCPITRLLLDKPDGPVPRGLKRDGPALLSYGFRPFFLGGGLFAALAMTIWLSALVSGTEPGGSYGSSHWHAHEMLFGFAPAILAGFLLTAIPNWTGRLPVSGLPLALLFGLWIAGRLVMIDPDVAGLTLSATIDSAFIPAMLFVAGREIAAGRKWRDLKILAGLAALAVANILFHRDMVEGEHPAIAMSLAISAYTLLVMIIGGRIVPSFTRNYMAKQGRTDAPSPFARYDVVAILAGVVALAAWVRDPAATLTAPLAAVACGLHIVRLMRWKGLAVRKEKLLFVLHAAYLFVPLGFAAIAFGAIGLLDDAFVLHVLTIGAISTMMLAVMTRLSYALLFAAAVLRPLASLADAWQMPMLVAAGACFASSFLLFGLEHAPMLATRKG